MTNAHETNNRPVILVVEDLPDSLSLICDILRSEYRVKVASNGKNALRIARTDPQPELILLDIMMPDMDGYEVCRTLKADAATREIPVIFLTAKTDRQDEQEGLELGAADYITKPISPPIVLLRVRNQLELKRHRDHLAALVALRTKELEEANQRLKVLDAGSRDYLRTISHELRTPVNGLLGIGQLALYEIRDDRLRTEYQNLFSVSRKRLISAIDAALQLAELQCGSLSVATAPLDLTELIETTAASLRDLFARKSLSFEFTRSKPAGIIGNEELLGQSLLTLLKAAQKMATPGTAIIVRIDEEVSRQNLRISFQSLHLSKELQHSFFHTFSPERPSSFVEDLGLAVPLAAEVVRAMGGSVALDQSEAGAEFHLTLRKTPSTGVTASP